MGREGRGVEAKRVVGYVLSGSTLGIIFFSFFVLWFAPPETVDEMPLAVVGQTFAGTLASVDDSHLTLRLDDGRDQVFQVGSYTLFTVYGAPTIRPGSRVEVRCRRLTGKDAGQLRARAVRRVTPRVTGSPVSSPGGVVSPEPQGELSPPCTRPGTSPSP